MKHNYVKRLQDSIEDFERLDRVRCNLEKLLQRYNNVYCGQEDRPFKEYKVLLYRDYDTVFHSATIRVPVKYIESFLLELKIFGFNVTVEDVVDGEVGCE